MVEPLSVLVTGAAGGIGREVCRVFAEAGATVTGFDIDVIGQDELPSGVHAVVVDVTDGPAVEAAVSQIGDLDVLVHCAGMTSLGPFAGTPVEAFDRVLDLNLRGANLVTHATLPGLIRRGGRIGVLSSVAGFAPLVYRTAYSASKHALHGLFESLRAELVDEGVSVTMICPSFVDTGIDQRAAHHGQGEAGTWTTTGKVLTPEKLAHLVYAGILRRRRLVLPSVTARAAFVLSRIAPALFDRLMIRRIRRR